MCRYLAQRGHDGIVTQKQWAARVLVAYWVLVLATAMFVYLATRGPNDGLAGIWLDFVTLPASLALVSTDLVGTGAILATAALGFLQGCVAYMAFILLMGARSSRA
jgi:hypothetical protein